MSTASDSQKETTKTHSKTQDSGELVTILTAMTSGAMAGAVAKTTIAPLDRTKIIFQSRPFPIKYYKFHPLPGRVSDDACCVFIFIE